MVGSLLKGLVFCLLCVSGAALAQSSGVKNVAWVPVEGKDRELVIHMPEGFTRHANEGISVVWREHRPSVNNMGVVARMINGTVLMMSFYNGEAEEIQRMKIDMHSLKVSEDKRIGSFRMKEFHSRFGKTHHRIQHYVKGRRIYVLESYALDKEDKISKGFFDSLRLIEDGKAIAPNVGADAKQTWLPKLTESTDVVPDERVYTAEEVDRDVIIIYSPAPREERHFIKGRIPQFSEVEVVYGSTGKIESVHGVRGLITHQANANEAVKNVIFIPAQKDGRPVSVRRKMSYRG